MDYEEMRSMEKTHCCAQCGAPLVTTWDRDKNEYQLVCGYNRTHQGYQQSLSPARQIQRGEGDKMMGKGAQKEMEERAEKGTLSLSRLPNQDVATNKVLPPAQVNQLVVWAKQLGLNAYLGHVCLYHGKPYVTIDGYYYQLHKEQPDISIGTKPMDASQRKLFSLKPGDYGYIATPYKDGKELEWVGVGIVTQAEMQAKSKGDIDQFRAPVVHEHPQRMAEKRAEWQLLRKLVPLEEKE